MEVFELDGLPIEAVQRIRQLADILKNDKGGALKMIDELIDEIKWDLAFNNSQNAIDKLAEEALVEIEAGYAEPMDLNKL
ncbi:MAG: hypothetical protein HQK99_17110 [Nitrospirae bacterium]|nr:hypothetical protein [Nitrospirota bacterium]